ncbi:MAG TPA: cell division protein SepF [Acidimicrobiia bacterium]|nr:cell division protein SepF [Acidimicrobiia bacterium]
MSSLFSKALIYLGLVDEDGVESEAGERPPTSPAEDQPRRVEPRRVEAMPQSRRVEPPPTARAATRPSSREGLETVGVIRTVDSQSDIIVVEEFGDARILADRIRDRVPVVLDMRRADHDLVRRVVDFSSGLIYALDGSMRKVGDGLVMVLPPRVTLSRDEKRRLSTLGAYELDDVDD